MKVNFNLQYCNFFNDSPSQEKQIVHEQTFNDQPGNKLAFV